MNEVANARDDGDLEREQYAQKMVDYFTQQLNEANPILTEISEAMTEEGRCQEKMSALVSEMKIDEAATWKEKMEAAAERKRLGNYRLMECSARYNDLMKSIRESRSTV